MRVRVVGLDISLTSTGVADILITDPGCSSNPDAVDIYTATIKSPALPKQFSQKTSGDWLKAMAGRLDHAHLDAASLLYEWEVLNEDARPELAVIESPSFGSVGGSGHERGFLWWGLAVALRQFDIPVLLVTPNQRAKYAAGHGGATKTEVVTAVNAMYGESLDTGLLRNSQNDEADAVTLAAIGARVLGYPLEEATRARVEVMKALKLPSEILP